MPRPCRSSGVGAALAPGRNVFCSKFFKEPYFISQSALQAAVSVSFPPLVYAAQGRSSLQG
jgi:hypothetical protein